MPRYKGEYISKEAALLEKQLKEKYGNKRGSAMIVTARQNVEYELDSANYSQIHFTKLLIEEFKNKL